MIIKRLIDKFLNFLSRDIELKGKGNTSALWIDEKDGKIYFHPILGRCYGGYHKWEDRWYFSSMEEILDREWGPLIFVDDEGNKHNKPVLGRNKIYSDGEYIEERIFEILE